MIGAGKVHYRIWTSMLLLSFCFLVFAAALVEQHEIQRFQASSAFNRRTQKFRGGERGRVCPLLLPHWSILPAWSSLPHACLLSSSSLVLLLLLFLFVLGLLVPLHVPPNQTQAKQNRSRSSSSSACPPASTLIARRSKNPEEGQNAESTTSTNKPYLDEHAQSHDHHHINSLETTRHGPRARAGLHWPREKRQSLYRQNTQTHIKHIKNIACGLLLGLQSNNTHPPNNNSKQQTSHH